eukprot:scaffold39784_cov47-Phaeocystis_antarctica.AAC.1
MVSSSPSLMVPDSSASAAMWKSANIHSLNSSDQRRPSAVWYLPQGGGGDGGALGEQSSWSVLSYLQGRDGGSGGLGGLGGGMLGLDGGGSGWQSPWSSGGGGGGSGHVTFRSMLKLVFVFRNRCCVTESIRAC